MTFKERMKELHRIYVADRKHVEVRHTAVGWQPAGYVEDKGTTPSGEREYFRIVREGKK